MTAAALMVAHQIAAKALRDAAFLQAWPATALPAMVLGTAAVAIAAVPIFARLLGRFGPRAIVPAAFLLSAAGHVFEWTRLGGGRWVAVAIYLHVAGLGALLLSGFWSVAGELFEPKTAKASFGRIAAAGTLGGTSGGLAAAVLSPANTLLLLAGIHLCCAITVWTLGRSAPRAVDAGADDASPVGWAFLSLRPSPHLRTMAAMVVLSSASAAIIDQLFRSQASGVFLTAADKQRFFAVFYASIQAITFLGQIGASQSVRRYGLGRTISSLPTGLGITSGAALLFPSAPPLPMLAMVRGTESVLRGSLFRSAYELLFVPMDPAEKRRMKTFLDVTCDRAGEACGAVVFRTALWLSGASLLVAPQLLAVVIVMAGVGLLLARRLDALYVKVVEQQLARHASSTPMLVASEVGWTVVDLPTPQLPAGIVGERPVRAAPPPRDEDPRLRLIGDLRSGDRPRVERALDRATGVDQMVAAQVIQLMAWDDVVPKARAVLERHAASHVGLLVDALLRPDTEFAIRRRLPRILGLVADGRAIDGLVRGLEDARFEVRYQCGRAIERLLMRHDDLHADRDRILAAIEREVSVSPQIWQGYQLIDRIEKDEETAAAGPPRPRNLEHVFTLLSAVLPRDPVQVAFHGLLSGEPGLRGLAVEYLDSVLPQALTSTLLEKATASADDAHARSGPPPPATPA
jgi:hypothetical protein